MAAAAAAAASSTTPVDLLEAGAPPAAPEARADVGELAVKVLSQHYLLRLLGSFLDPESVACLLLALPRLLRKEITSPYHLASWGRRDARRSPARRTLRLDPTSPFLDLYSFITFHHLHQHAYWLKNHYGYPRNFDYTTGIFRVHLMQPSTKAFAVRACLFLPVEGPPAPFAGNLVLLGYGGQLVFFAPTLAGFEMTANTQLGCSPHSLTRSPGGGALLAAHENSVFVRLKHYTVQCFFTGVPVARKTFLSDCFVDEDAFVTGDKTGNVWLHTVAGTRGPAGRTPARKKAKEEMCIDSELLLDHRHHGAARWPFDYGSDRRDFGVMYKPVGPESRDCLVMLQTDSQLAWGHQLRFHFAPRVGETKRQFRDLFVYFRGLIADLVLHPNGESLFVAVLTTLDRKQFFDHLIGGVSAEGWGANEELHEYEKGYVCVYEVKFVGGVELTVHPKYYLDGTYPGSPRHDHPRRYVVSCKTCQNQGKFCVRIKCGATTLAVKLSTQLIAHLPLVSTGESTVLHQVTDMHAGEFAFSEYHSFGACFTRNFRVAAQENQAGLMACVKQNRFCPDVMRIKDGGRLVETTAHCHTTH